ncbi:MAG: hypothetical protein LH491_01265, partial [Pseudoxanthomonas sp.]|nr:hypothetical protein [Pseudoxanthomonas sp.]
MASKGAQEAGIVDQEKRALASSFLQGSREECEPSTKRCEPSCRLRPLKMVGRDGFEPRLDYTRTPLPGTRRSAPRCFPMSFVWWAVM